MVLWRIVVETEKVGFADRSDVDLVQLTLHKNVKSSLQLLTAVQSLLWKVVVSRIPE